MGYRCVKCLFCLLPICNSGTKKKVQPNQTQSSPKPGKLSKWSSSHYFSLHLLPKCFGHFLADEEWWDLPLLEEFSSYHNWDLSAREKVTSSVPESAFLWEEQGSVELSVAAVLEELLPPLFFREPPWNVFMLREKRACNFPELLAAFQEGIVLCVNSFWGRCVVIAAPRRMGGKEIPFSLQSCALRFFC